jgi:hypothetical protein
MSSSISLVFSDLFNHASLGLILILDGVIRFLERVPFGSFSDVHLGLFSLLAWYLLLGLLTAVLWGYFGRPPVMQKTA